MVAKQLCLDKTKEILETARKLRTTVFKKDLREEEWENHYQELVHINGMLHEAFHAL